MSRRRRRGVQGVIFDQDGTLYPRDSPLGTLLTDRTKEWLQRRLTIAPTEIDDFYGRVKAQWHHPYVAWKALGLVVDDYLSEVFETVELNGLIGPSEGTLRTLRALTARKAVVTLAPRGYSERLQRLLEIDAHLERTYYVKDTDEPYSKGVSYARVCRDWGLEPQSVCVVGDSYWVDIAPALELGCRGVLVGGQPLPNVEAIATLEGLLSLLDTDWEIADS